MKKLLLSAVFAASVFSAATAANITLYYSPTCPHCHNAREFISQTLAYEYPSLVVEAVNVMEQENMPAFQAALLKCKYESGGVPVLVIGDECMQGYAPVLDDDVRKYVEIGMSDAEKNAAVEIRKEMEANPQQFRDAHQDRANVIAERGAEVQKKTDAGSSSIYFYAILIVLVLGLGVVLIRGRKK
jgi:glutaredoxin